MKGFSKHNNISYDTSLWERLLEESDAERERKRAELLRAVLEKPTIYTLAEGEDIVEREVESVELGKCRFGETVRKQGLKIA